MTKKILHSLVVLGLLAGLCALAAQPGYAQDATETGTPAAETPIDVAPAATPIPLPTDGSALSFSSLGLGEDTLHGPFDLKRVVFSLPADWKLRDGAELHLDTAIFSGGTSLSSAAPITLTLIGSLEVTFNGTALTILQLDRVGESSMVIPLPTEVLTPTRSDGRHELSLFLNSVLNCEYNQQTSVLIHATSFFLLPHDSVPPSTDLVRLPRPIFQDTFLPEAATIVVPDQPTPGELQAALTTAAGFGKMTSGQLPMSLTRVGQLLAEEQNANHLIFVGNPLVFPPLGGVALPTPAPEVGYQPGDGLIQMAVSPWNSARAVLVVGGDSDTAVVKAAQALSTGMVRASAQPNLAVIADIQPAAPAGTVAADRTLADLGYDNIAMERIGENTTEFRFYVPPGQGASADAYLDLIFSHSALLEYNRSGLVVNLNDTPIGSARFSDETAQRGTLRLIVPATAIRPGLNRLAVQANLAPRSACADPRLTRLWLTLHSESLLHLPLGPVEGRVNTVFDLSKFPDPFGFSATLNNTAFVLAPNDPAGWDVAAQLAFELGKVTNTPLANLMVVYGDAIPETVRQERDLIIIGRPSQLPIIAELGDALPAPFAPGSDIATERTSAVIYRLPPGASVSYLEMLAAPWNSARTILAVLGNSDEGLRWAAAALLPPLRSRLAGNFAVVNGTQIVANDTRLVANPASLVATAVPGGATQPAPLPESTAIARPNWILPALGMSGLLMVVIAGIVILNSWQQRRSAARTRRG